LFLNADGFADGRKLQFDHKGTCQESTRGGK